MSHKNRFQQPLSFNGKLIKYYVNQARVQQSLLSIIKSTLPPHLKDHVSHGIVSNNKVILYTNSPAWSSQLRFYHQPILNKVRTIKKIDVLSLQIKIMLPKNKTKLENTLLIPSKENINNLFNLAHNMSDSQLKSALLKLGNTLEKVD